jgi:alkylhydroperoxidase/carboxymuconolactone decarboxylase family protein YurZ
MADTLDTPVVDRLRHNGAWNSSLDHFYEWDPDWIERCARMSTNPWTTGILPIKWIELICIALNAACTHRNEPGVRRHIRAALKADATREEILTTLKGVSVLGVHSLALAVPILLEEARQAGIQPVTHPPGTVATPVVDRMRTAGLFNEAWDVIYTLDPLWLDEFLAMGADLYSGVLPAKLVEIMALAVDASCTHLYAPGVRRHLRAALAQGATTEEIMEALKLCGALGVDACELGAPILAHELASTRPEK